MKMYEKHSFSRVLERVVSASLAAALCLALAACGKAPATVSSSSSPSDVSASTEPVSLTMWMGSWWEDQIPTIVDAYKKVAPNVNLTIEALPVNGYVDKAVTTILGGDGPDILTIDVTQAATFIDKNLLQPWNDHIADYDLSDFSSITDACKQGDVYYGLPYRCSSSIMYYNKAMFDEAKLPYPEEGWTYDDYLELARALTIPGQQYGTGVACSKDDPSNVMTSFAPVLWAYGADFVNEDQTECTLNTPKAIEATTYWTNLYTTEKVVPEGTLNYTISKDLMPLFIDGRVAMMLSADQTAKEIDANHPEVQYGFVTPPAGPVGAGGWMFSVPVTAKHSQEAFDFCKWFLQPEVLGELTIRVPSRLNATKYGEWEKPLYQTMVKAAMNGKLSPTTPKWTDMQIVIITELQNIMQGSKTVEQGCQDMTDQCNALLKS